MAVVDVVVGDSVAVVDVPGAVELTVVRGSEVLLTEVVGNATVEGEGDPWDEEHPAAKTASARSTGGAASQFFTLGDSWNLIGRPDAFRGSRSAAG
jgi:hypothetical protein